MRSVRPLLFAFFFVAAFYFVTTSRYAPQALHTPSWVTRPSQLEITSAAGPEKLDAEEQNNVEVYNKVVPAVVNITSRMVAYDFFYGAVPEEGMCSGFLIDKEGHILTNYHCVANARQLEVTLHHNERKFKAEIVGTDHAHDLAIIQIPARDMPSVTLGDSHGLQVGQKVYAIGNPFGLSGTMSRGIISSLRPVQTPTGANIEEAIQTDAAINPGNSGGPLLNSHGEVIGINTMIATGGANQSAGIGFAIPINTAKVELEELVKFGHARRPALGVRSLPIGPELAKEIGLPADYGLLIMQVVPGSGAERAGLRGGNERASLGNIEILLGGDLIVGLDGKDVREQRDLSNILNQHRPGDTVKVTIYRGKRKMDLQVILSEAQQQG